MTSEELDAKILARINAQDRRFLRTRGQRVPLSVRWQVGILIALGGFGGLLVYMHLAAHHLWAP